MEAQGWRIETSSRRRVSAAVVAVAGFAVLLIQCSTSGDFSAAGAGIKGIFLRLDRLRNAHVHQPVSDGCFYRGRCLPRAQSAFDDGTISHGESDAEQDENPEGDSQGQLSESSRSCGVGGGLAHWLRSLGVPLFVVLWKNSHFSLRF